MHGKWRSKEWFTLSGVFFIIVLVSALRSYTSYSLNHYMATFAFQILSLVSLCLIIITLIIGFMKKKK
jgi:hypothetical protein